MNLRGKFMTDKQGRFWFRTVKMVGYPIPTDGVVGRLLAAQGRGPGLLAAGSAAIAGRRRRLISRVRTAVGVRTTVPNRR